MATIESMSIRINQALDEIETAINNLKQGEARKPLPRSQRDREMLRVLQFETIAQWLNEIIAEKSLQKDVTLMFENRMETQDKPLRGRPRK